ncbi:MAG: RdgB/HAM1 family non-canonical purine NTP pyrophosphatase, partial [Clostridia bacterium]|nr:RdgB/HAM1 family non-canonical purine NTP pyrophosphatase [Clostridia bacterium]
MKILLATRNKNKAREVAAILSEYRDQLGEIELLTLDDAGFPDDVEENGSTFEENAMIKARAGAASGFITLADDSGIEVDALGGAPGIYSARFAGSHGDDKANNELLLRKLRGVPKEKRTARYAVAIACVLPDGETFTVRGTTEGLILDSYDGAGGFGYDPLFWSLDLQKSFGRATPEEKNGVSHRGRAVRLAASELIRRLQTQNERNIK